MGAAATATIAAARRFAGVAAAFVAAATTALPTPAPATAPATLVVTADAVGTVRNASVNVSDKVPANRTVT